MAWVRSAYAGELSVLMAWLSALLPWSVSYATDGPLSLVVVRFPFFLVQFVFGATIEGERPFLPVWAARTFEQGGIAQAYAVWLAGAVVVALAFAFSVVYYARDASLEARLPVDPARLLGVALLAAGLALCGSWGMLAFGLFGAGYPGVTVPVGAIFTLGFGVVLVTVERT